MCAFEIGVGPFSPAVTHPLSAIRIDKTNALTARPEALDERSSIALCIRPLLTAQLGGPRIDRNPPLPRCLALGIDLVVVQVDREIHQALKIAHDANAPEPDFSKFNGATPKEILGGEIPVWQVM